LASSRDRTSRTVAIVLLIISLAIPAAAPYLLKGPDMPYGFPLIFLISIASQLISLALVVWISFRLWGAEGGMR